MLLSSQVNRAALSAITSSVFSGKNITKANVAAPRPTSTPKWKVIRQVFPPIRSLWKVESRNVDTPWWGEKMGVWNKVNVIWKRKDSLIEIIGEIKDRN